MKRIAGYPVHPAANLFPMLEPAAFAKLVADIKANGLREPVTIYEGKLLDGRNRAKACKAAKVKIKERRYKGKDPVAYVVSLNLARRHLSESQRGMVGARLTGNDHGGDRRSSGKFATRSYMEAAKEMSVGARTVRHAKAVIERGAPELVAAVDADHIAVSLAAKVAELPASEQRKIAKRAADGEKPSAIMREHSRKKRESKMATIRKGNKALAADQKYSVILADPPWLYNEGTTTPNRRIDNHYPMMPLDEICALPVRKLADKNAVLFLCITSPLLLEAAPALLKAWGKWNYKSQWIWHKDGKRKKDGSIGGYRGTGHWAIIEHELILICTRGDVPTPSVSARFPSVFTAPVGQHSEKPAEIHRRIELMYPKQAKIELFCRDPRKGWDVWGNQAD